MKRMLATMLMISSIPAAFALDHSSRGSVRIKPIAGNVFVDVLRISLTPHAKTPMHEVTPRVVVWLSDAHFVDHYADGTTREETRKAGDAEWVSARRHSGENLSDQPMEFIAVVVKAAATH